MAQTAANLVVHVILRVPVRQCVTSLPIPLRLLLAAAGTCRVATVRCGTDGRLRLEQDGSSWAHC